MFTKNDLKFKSVFVLNCTEHNKTLRVKNGEFFLEQDNEPLSKFPFQKILAIIIIGDSTLTTPFIDKCSYYGIPLISTKSNLRPTFVYAPMSEGNYLVRQNQFILNQDNLFLPFAVKLVQNKISNTYSLISKLRGDNLARRELLNSISLELNKLNDIAQNTANLVDILTIEARVAKKYFSYFFKDFNWKKRLPRIKIDYINVILDIGYTLLFNFMECFARFFGFDIYIGVYHRLWFRRKSLICDFVEPFRCIIDKLVRKNLNLKVFSSDDFICKKNQFYLKYDKCKLYYSEFMSALVDYKIEIFAFILSFYRGVMTRDASKIEPFNYSGAKR